MLTKVVDVTQHKRDQRKDGDETRRFTCDIAICVAYVGHENAWEQHHAVDDGTTHDDGTEVVLVAVGGKVLAEKHAFRDEPRECPDPQHQDSYTFGFRGELATGMFAKLRVPKSPIHLCVGA